VKRWNQLGIFFPWQIIILLFSFFLLCSSIIWFQLNNTPCSKWATAWRDINVTCCKHDVMVRSMLPRSLGHVFLIPALISRVHAARRPLTFLYFWIVGSQICVRQPDRTGLFVRRHFVNVQSKCQHCVVLISFQTKSIKVALFTLGNSINFWRQCVIPPLGDSASR